MHNFTVHQVPWPIDTDVFYPEDKVSARRALGINNEERIILFGSEGGSKDPRKGADLFRKSLENHPQILGPCTVLAFGGPFDFAATPEMKIKHLGPLANNKSLRLAYSASDVLVLPSRKDNHSLVGIEAHACGLPVVGFSNSGVRYQIQNGLNGHLATDGNSESLARAIATSLEGQQDYSSKSKEISSTARQVHSPETVGKTLCGIYDSALQI